MPDLFGVTVGICLPENPDICPRHECSCFTWSRPAAPTWVDVDVKWLRGCNHGQCWSDFILHLFQTGPLKKSITPKLDSAYMNMLCPQQHHSSNRDSIASLSHLDRSSNIKAVSIFNQILKHISIRLTNFYVQCKCYIFYMLWIVTVPAAYILPAIAARVIDSSLVNIFLLHNF